MSLVPLVSSPDVSTLWFTTSFSNSLHCVTREHATYFVTRCVNTVTYYWFGSLPLFVAPEDGCHLNHCFRHQLMCHDVFVSRLLGLLPECGNVRYFLCGSGDCIHRTLLCDGHPNCHDNSDEWACGRARTRLVCYFYCRSFNVFYMLLLMLLLFVRADYHGGRLVPVRETQAASDWLF